MKNLIDLHVHTSCSDGTLTPEEVVATALDLQLAAIAITDHDTAAGVARAKAAVHNMNNAPNRPGMETTPDRPHAPNMFGTDSETRNTSGRGSQTSNTSGRGSQPQNTSGRDSQPQNTSGRDSQKTLEILAGIEISAEWLNKEIHILGLDLDPDHPALKNYQDEFLREKEERNRKIAEKITAVGCPVTPEEIQERFPGAVLGRPHYARFMMEKGFVTSVNAAFNQYLGDNGPCYVSRRRISASDAVKLILDCGGHPVLAHPLQYGFSKDRLESLVNYLKDFGLEGMECYYSRYTATDSAKLIKMAGRHRLFVTGGSDFHGGNKPEIALGSGINGNLQIPYSLLQDAGLRP